MEEIKLNVVIVSDNERFIEEFKTVLYRRGILGVASCPPQTALAVLEAFDLVVAEWSLKVLELIYSMRTIGSKIQDVPLLLVDHSHSHAMATAVAERPQVRVSLVGRAPWYSREVVAELRKLPVWKDVLPWDEPKSPAAKKTKEKKNKGGEKKKK